MDGGVMHVREGEPGLRKPRFEGAENTVELPLVEPQDSPAAFSDALTISPDSYDNSTSLDKTPAYSPEVARQLERRDSRTELALAVTKYLAKIPKIMSLPAPRLLALRPESEILGLEEMYRRLDWELKDILERHGPQWIKFPVFDEFLQVSHSSGPVDKLQDQYQIYAHFLPNHLYREVVSSLELYAAFAEVIGNAKAIQKQGY